MMKRSKGSWYYRFTYQMHSAPPKEVNIFKFGLHFLMTALAWGMFWLVIGISCFLFAYKWVKNDEEFLAPINKWPTILGHRIWPLSLIGLGFIIWPFVDYKSWIRYDIFFPITLFSLCMFVWCVFTKKTWEEICERTKIVFTENGKA